MLEVRYCVLKRKIVLCHIDYSFRFLVIGVLVARESSQHFFYGRIMPRMPEGVESQLVTIDFNIIITLEQPNILA